MDNKMDKFVHDSIWYLGELKADIWGMSKLQ